MDTIDLRLAGGSVRLPGLGFQKADVLVTDGRISAITEPGTGPTAEATVSVAGLTVLPGACDVHLHLGHGSDIARPRVPSDAASETAAAAIGGVTSFIPYVMSPTPYGALFDELRQVTEAGARIDFGFHFVISTDEQLAELPRYITEFGVPTAKLFMNIRGDEGKRLGLPGTDDGFLFRLLEALAAHGGMLCPHPENIEVAWVLRDRVLAADPDGANGLATWNDTRPPFVEADAIRRACYFGRVTGAPVYTVHTSSGEALAAAIEQRRQGSRVTIETCTHYLTHDTSTDIGAIGKVNPPLRTPEDREALWLGIRDGHIDTIATDHIHRPVSSKDGGIWKAQPGFPGLDAFLPALFTEGHHKRGIPLERLVDLVTCNPADAMALAPRKGRIALGTDADFAILDMNAPWTVDKSSLATDAGYSIYEGQEMACRVVHTLVRGRFVVRDGAVAASSEGTGRFMPRRLQASPR
ncbi:MAG: dihydroorotase family protein [Alphaproteobacteria bacterium]|nr:dihydroorotase family protein [Alphaproteobacteria bacterium]